MKKLTYAVLTTLLFTTSVAPYNSVIRADTIGKLHMNNNNITSSSVLETAEEKSLKEEISSASMTGCTDDTHRKKKQLVDPFSLVSSITKNAQKKFIKNKGIEPACLVSSLSTKAIDMDFTDGFYDKGLSFISNSTLAPIIDNDLTTQMYISYSTSYQFTMKINRPIGGFYINFPESGHNIIVEFHNFSSSVTHTLEVAKSGYYEIPESFNERVYRVKFTTSDSSKLAINEFEMFGKEVVFNDDTFKNLITDELGKPRGTTLREDNMWELTDIDFSSKGIKSVRGIEYALLLETANFSSNEISDFSPLEDLQTNQDYSYGPDKYLNNLNVSNNQLSNFIAKSSKLETLNISENIITSSSDIDKYGYRVSNLDYSKNFIEGESGQYAFEFSQDSYTFEPGTQGTIDIVWKLDGSNSEIPNQVKSPKATLDSGSLEILNTSGNSIDVLVKKEGENFILYTPIPGYSESVSVKGETPSPETPPSETPPSETTAPYNYTDGFLDHGVNFISTNSYSTAISDNNLTTQMSVSSSWNFSFKINRPLGGFYINFPESSGHYITVELMNFDESGTYKLDVSESGYYAIPETFNERVYKVKFTSGSSSRLYINEFEMFGKEVVFKDDTFKNLITDELGKPRGTTLREEHMWYLTEMDFPSEEITSVQGIEYALNLETANFSSNKIDDFSPFEELQTNQNYSYSTGKYLTNLNVSNNQLSSFIAKSSKLKNLNISNNFITNTSDIDKYGYRISELDYSKNFIEGESQQYSFKFGKNLYNFSLDTPGTVDIVWLLDGVETSEVPSQVRNPKAEFQTGSGEILETTTHYFKLSVAQDGETIVTYTPVPGYSKDATILTGGALHYTDGFMDYGYTLSPTYSITNMNNIFDNDLTTSGYRSKMYFTFPAFLEYEKFYINFPEEKYDYVTVTFVDNADSSIRKEVKVTKSGYYDVPPRNALYRTVEIAPSSGTLYINEFELFGEEVEFEDDTFKNLIADELGKPDDSILRAEHMLYFTDMDFSSKGITSVKGIEHALNLKTANFSNNKIEHFTYFRFLQNEQKTGTSGNIPFGTLTTLDVSDNLLVEASLNNAINYLDISNNRITDKTDISSYKLKILLSSKKFYYSENFVDGEKNQYEFTFDQDSYEFELNPETQSISGTIGINWTYNDNPISEIPEKALPNFEVKSGPLQILNTTGKTMEFIANQDGESVVTFTAIPKLPYSSISSTLSKGYSKDATVNVKSAAELSLTMASEQMNLGTLRLGQISKAQLPSLNIKNTHKDSSWNLRLFADESLTSKYFDKFNVLHEGTSQPITSNGTVLLSSEESGETTIQPYLELQASSSYLFKNSEAFEDISIPLTVELVLVSGP